MLKVNFTPFPEIYTERLLLRRIRKEDIPQLLALRSNDTVMKYIDKEYAGSLEEAKEFFKKANDALETNDGIVWGITMKDHPALLIGYIGFWRLIKEHHRAEIGYMLLPPFWQKGIMKEAIEKTLDYGFTIMKLHSVEGRINPENIASASLLKSAGFIKEAYFKEDFFFKGKFGDTEVYSRLKIRPLWETDANNYPRRIILLL